MGSAKQLSGERTSGAQASGERVSGTRRAGLPAEVTPADRLPGGEIGTWLVLAALAVAVLDQGGFYAAAQWALGIALVAAVAVVAVTTRTAQSAQAAQSAQPVRLLPRSWAVPAAAGFACAGWAFADGWLHGAPGTGVRPALLVIAAGAVIGLCQRLGTAQRVRLVPAVLYLGCLAGLLGWYGVASHSPAFALPGQGLWRAMGTLSYPNAAAALLAMLLVAAVARQVRHGPADWPAGLASTALLVGLGATLSRGGLVAATAGVGVLAALLGPRRVLAALAGPVLGAALALAGLLPGLPSTTAPHLGTAAAALAVGLVAGAGTPAALHLLRSRLSRPVLADVGCLLVLAAGFGAVLAGAGDRSVLAALRQARFTLSSTDRVAAWHAVTEVIARHPVIGAGPGLRTFSWSDPGGGVLVFAYAHNEYLQVLAELGAVGLVFLTAGLAAVLRVLWHCRPRSAGGEQAAVAVGALTAVCTSALFDFTWHFPALVLTAAALVGCAEPAVRPPAIAAPPTPDLPIRKASP